MYCAISGEVPETPVVNKKTGQVFEERLLRKHVDNGGKCPLTGEEIGEDDILPLKVTKVVKPRPATASSIPGILGTLQNEWDALMLETFHLKQALDTTRQELSQALYQHDAACRVVARLTRERDEARAALQEAQRQMAQMAAHGGSGEAGGPSAMETDIEEGITPEVISKIEQTAKKLTKGRKKRQLPPDLVGTENIRKFAPQSSHTIHQTDKPGVLCLALHPRNENLSLTGGMDKTAQLFDRSAGKVVSALKGHSRRVTGVAIHPTEDLMFTCSHDKSVRVYSDQGQGYDCSHVIAAHSAEATGISIHPCGEYLASASLDRSWSFIDIRRGKVLSSVTSADVQQGFEDVSFHPDGLLLATAGADNVVRVWDVKAQSNVATCAGHEGVVHSVSFSENGYYMATGSEDGSLKVWDLRKLAELKSLTVGSPVHGVRFDYSGQYLGAAAADVRVYVVKEWDCLAKLDAHTASATDVAFGPNAKFVASTGMDRSLRFYYE